jgi:hypothetical protein
MNEVGDLVRRLLMTDMKKTFRPTYKRVELVKITMIKI